MKQTLLPSLFTITLTAVAADTSTNTAVSDYPNPPGALPGKGLVQHDFVYTGRRKSGFRTSKMN